MSTLLEEIVTGPVRVTDDSPAQPLSATDRAPTRPAHPGIEAPAQPIRVLLVDDDPMVVRGLSLMLEAGSDGEISVVGTAADGTEVVRAVQAHYPDVVLMDVRMPRQDGIATTREIVGNSQVMRATLEIARQAGDGALRLPVGARAGKALVDLTARQVQAPDRAGARRSRAPPRPSRPTRCRSAPC